MNHVARVTVNIKCICGGEIKRGDERQFIKHTHIAIIHFICQNRVNENSVINTKTKNE